MERYIIRKKEKKTNRQLDKKTNRQINKKKIINISQ